MEELKALIKEQNELLKTQNDLLVAGFASLLEFDLITLKRQLDEEDPNEPEVVAHRLKSLMSSKCFEAINAIQEHLKAVQRNR